MHPKRCNDCQLVRNLSGQKRKCPKCKKYAMSLRRAVRRYEHVVDKVSYEEYKRLKAIKHCKTCQVLLPPGYPRLVCRGCKYVVRKEVEIVRLQMPVDASCIGCGASHPVPHHIHGTVLLVAPLCRNCNLGVSYFNDSPEFMAVVAGRLRGLLPPAPPWPV